MMQSRRSYGSASQTRCRFGPTAAAAAAAILVAPIMLSTKTPVSPERARLAEAYGQIPLAFEANAGQTDPQVAFLTRGAGYALFLTPGEAVLSLRPSLPREKPAGPNRAQANQPLPPAVLRLKCRGANPSPRVTGLEPQKGRSNYFIGNDPSRWRTDVPRFGKVRYEDVYPGIDLVYYGRQRQLEFDFVVGPGADPRQIGLDFEGADKIETDALGDLIVQIRGGVLRQHKPVVYQERDGERQPVPGEYIVESDRHVAFHLGDYDTSRPLVIDPVLAYSTYLGGSGGDFGNGIAVDGAGNAYIAGYTSSTNFPTANPFQAARAGFNDVFVAKLNAAGSALVYSTYLGGSGSQYGWGIAVDGSGSAYVTGRTTSTSFPTANPFQGTNHGSPFGDGDAFVTKLNASGSALVYSTYLGGYGWDCGYGIAVDGSGNAYVTGDTQSGDFPTANPFQSGHAGGTYDAFVTKLNAAGSALVYSTYLGGSSLDDHGFEVAVDGSSNAYITGYTGSIDFPTANPIQGAFGGGTYDALVTKLNAAGSALVYSTYLGGNGRDYGGGIAVDVAGNAYVAGSTQSTDFPTANPFQGTRAGQEDAFVTKLNAAGSALVYSTYLGGSASDGSGSIAVDVAGNAYVAGTTKSTNFPTANPIQGTYAGGTNDVYVTKLNAAGSALVCSTYLGGSDDDGGSGIAVDVAGNAYVAGTTKSTNFPTVNPIQGASGGYYDIFVAKLGAGADVSITKTDGATTEVPGTPVTYTIVVTNAGPSNAPSVTVADTFPATCTGASWACAGAGGGSCALSGSGNISDNANLPAGGSATYTATCTISASATGSLSNTATATVGGGVGDPTPGNNSATDTDTLTPQADLSVTLLDAPDPVTGLGTLTYTITVANTGPSAASGVSVVHTLPAGVTFSSATGSGWSCSAPGAVTCDLASLASGATAPLLSVQVTVGPASGTLTSSVTVTATSGDPNAANNSASEATTVNGVPYADLSVAITNDGVTVLWGRPLTYTLTATNGGPDAVTGAGVSDSFPAGLAGVSWTCTASAGSSCAATGSGAISDTAVDLLTGGTATYSATGVVVYGTASPLVNTATVSSSIHDPVAANNSSTVNTPVDVDLIFKDGFQGSP